MFLNFSISKASNLKDVKKHSTSNEHQACSQQTQPDEPIVDKNPKPSDADVEGSSLCRPEFLCCPIRRAFIKIPVS